MGVLQILRHDQMAGVRNFEMPFFKTHLPNEHCVEKHTLFLYGEPEGKP